MKKLSVYILLLWVLTIITSCKKDQTPSTAENGKVNLNINYTFNGNNIILDTLLYTNTAGYRMSVSMLDYYISGLTFYHADSSTETVNVIQYISISDSSSNHFSCTLPNGNYVAMKFYIGLDSIHNKSGYLPSTPENLNMGWPDIMGGGYHFLKLQGYYIDNAGTFGYTVHLGTNKHLVKTNLIQKSLSISNSASNVSLTMDINNWFKKPFIYDFDKDGNYTMNNDTAMAKIAANGAFVFN